MKDSGNRWWEIRGEGQPDDAEGNYRDLLTDSRGRNRPERSLSVGIDPADEAHHGARPFLWPTVSVVAAVALILSVSYGVSRSRATPPSSTVAAEPTAKGSTQRDVEPKPDADVKPFAPPAPLANLPTADSAPPPIGRPVADGDRAASQREPSSPAAVPGDRPSDNSAGASGSAPYQPFGTPTPSSSPTPEPVPSVQLAGPAPTVPGRQQDGPPVSGAGGCTKSSGGGHEYYACTITQTAPAYLAGTTRRGGTVRAERYPFRCQSDGSKYSVGNRASSWWAWIGTGGTGVWIPVVFLTGGPDNGPEPGLPVCGKGSATTSPDTRNPPKSAATAKNVVDRKTKRCLDSNDKGNAYTLECNGGDYQKWYAPGDGTIRDKKTGRCLDSNDSGNAYTLECNGGDYQKWQAPGDGTIRDKKTGRCLDSNDSGNAYTLECNGGDYQKWDIA